MTLPDPRREALPYDVRATRRDPTPPGKSVNTALLDPDGAVLTCSRPRPLRHPRVRDIGVADVVEAAMRRRGTVSAPRAGDVTLVARGAP